MELIKNQNHLPQEYLEIASKRKLHVCEKLLFIAGELITAGWTTIEFTSNFLSEEILISEALHWRLAQDSPSTSKRGSQQERLPRLFHCLE